MACELSLKAELQAGGCLFGYSISGASRVDTRKGKSTRKARLALRCNRHRRPRPAPKSRTVRPRPGGLFGRGTHKWGRERKLKCEIVGIVTNNGAHDFASGVYEFFEPECGKRYGGILPASGSGQVVRIRPDTLGALPREVHTWGVRDSIVWFVVVGRGGGWFPHSMYRCCGRNLSLFGIIRLLKMIGVIALGVCVVDDSRPGRERGGFCRLRGGGLRGRDVGLVLEPVDAPTVYWMIIRWRGEVSVAALCEAIVVVRAGA